MKDYYNKICNFYDNIITLGGINENDINNLIYSLYGVNHIPLTTEFKNKLNDYVINNNKEKFYSEFTYYVEQELTLEQYFNIKNVDVWEKEILSDRYIFIQKINSRTICIEITDYKGNSENINFISNIRLTTQIKHIEGIVLQALFDYYLYK